MIEAFKCGGDFHSRTALGMYDNIKQEVDAGNLSNIPLFGQSCPPMGMEIIDQVVGRVLLEWDSSKGKPTVPLLKDKYATERRRAKVLNFSIAYGKTVHGKYQ